VTRHVNSIALALVIASAVGTVIRAQGPVPAPVAGANSPQRPLTPLKVQVVVSKYQGEKKLSSLPYALPVNADDGARQPFGGYVPNNSGRVSLRMVVQVPIQTTVNGAVTTVYKDVGTSIDCYASTTDDGRFDVAVSVEDSSVYTDGQTVQGIAKVGDAPVLRSFRSNASLILKDGQTGQFTAATDKVSGETVRVDVTITVVK
jgi:hypothetical protein